MEQGVLCRVTEISYCSLFCNTSLNSLFHRCWLLSTCSYNSWKQGNVHLTWMCVVGIKWWTVLLLLQITAHGRAWVVQCGQTELRLYKIKLKGVPWRLSFRSSSYFQRNTNSWPICCQPSHAVVISHVPPEFSLVFWHYRKHDSHQFLPFSFCALNNRSKFTNLVCTLNMLWVVPSIMCLIIESVDSTYM